MSKAGFANTAPEQWANLSRFCLFYRPVSALSKKTVGLCARSTGHGTIQRAVTEGTEQRGSWPVPRTQRREEKGPSRWAYKLSES